MKKEELQKLISESLYEMTHENSIEEDEEEYELEPMSMSSVDMPIKDKGIFNAMSREETEEDMSDIAKYRKSKGGDYEGGFQDDVSVSPGYFNENDNDWDPIAIAKTNAASNYDPTQDAMEYAGEHWNTLTPIEKEELFADLENDFERNMGEATEFTSKELNKIINEGVEKLHRKNLIEGRLEQINNELNMINNPEAWENARTEAKSQLEKKTITWKSITDRPAGIIKEGLSEKGINTVSRWISEINHRGAAKKMIDSVLSRQIGMISNDLGDTLVFANGLDIVEEFLISGEIDAAFDAAKETANEMLEDEGMENMFESKKPKSNLSEMSFRDIEIPVVATKDTATKDANSKWNKMQNESVSEIMSRAADLMAEAKKKYNNISN